MAPDPSNLKRKASKEKTHSALTQPHACQLAAGVAGLCGTAVQAPADVRYAGSNDTATGTHQASCTRSSAQCNRCRSPPQLHPAA
eukprot:2775606-Rhodomonas_salina.1